MSKLPLEGVRILDFTWAAVGPYCTFLCSLMGAECIKVETSAHAGYFERRNPRVDAQLDVRTLIAQQWNVNELNVNKLSVMLDLKHPEGLHVARCLVALSDGVVDNFRGGVMQRLGMGYEELRQINPSIVVVSASTHGQGGPEGHGPGFAQIFGSLGGAAYLTGYEGEAPVELRLPSDLIAGTTAAFALLTGIYHARRTGQGQFVDLATRECFSGFVGEALLDASLNQRNQGRHGNRDQVLAPHNVYRCEGEDAWISIAVDNDEEWVALCQAVGHPEWLQDPRFADQNSRWHSQEELDRLLADWAIGQDAVEAMNLLQKAGVAASPSYSAADLLSDPHVSQRECLVVTENRDGEPWVMMGVPWRSSRISGEVRRPPPKMGLDIEHVIGKLLGMTAEELEKLAERGVLR
ncbi:MAG: CoA transferase [Chloroflexi bacterium]|nr:CoA transferase [Chloroflexota bacterium]